MGREGSTGCRGAGTGCVGTGGGNPPIDFSTSPTGTSTPAAERKWGPQGGRPDPPSWPVPQSPGEYGPVPLFREVASWHLTNPRLGAERASGGKDPTC